MYYYFFYIYKIKNVFTLTDFDVFCSWVEVFFFFVLGKHYVTY